MVLPSGALVQMMNTSRVAVISVPVRIVTVDVESGVESVRHRDVTVGVAVALINHE